MIWVIDLSTFHSGTMCLMIGQGVQQRLVLFFYWYYYSIIGTLILWIMPCFSIRLVLIKAFSKVILGFLPSWSPQLTEKKNRQKTPQTSHLWFLSWLKVKNKKKGNSKLPTKIINSWNQNVRNVIPWTLSDGLSSNYFTAILAIRKKRRNMRSY